MLWCSPYRSAVLGIALLIGTCTASFGQTEPILGNKTLRLFRGGVIRTTYIQFQPPNPLTTPYTLLWGSQPVGRNAVLYGSGYPSTPELRLTNSSTTLNDIFRMSDDDPPVPGWYPRNPNIWVTSGGNPVGAAPYLSSGELGAAPDVGSQWFGTLDASPIQFVAGLATAVPPNNLVRGVMSADGVLSLDSAISVGFVSASDIVSITNDSLPTSLMIRAPSIIRVQDINTNSGTPGIWKADSNTIFGVGIWTASPANLRTLGNTMFGREVTTTGIRGGFYGNHPLTNPRYFSGIRNTAFGYRASYINYYGGHTVAIGDSSIRLASYTIGDVAVGKNSLRSYNPGVSSVQTPIGPENATRIFPNTAVGVDALQQVSNPSNPYNVALGTRALRAGLSSGMIALGHAAGQRVQSNSDVLYVASDSSRNVLMLGSLTGRRLHINPPVADFSVTSPTRRPASIDVMLYVHANADSDEDGNPDPTPLNQYAVPENNTILSPSTMDPTLRLSVPENIPANLNDDAVRGTRTGGANQQQITDNTKNWVDNQWVGYRVLITGGAGVNGVSNTGQTREIIANNANTLTIAPPNFNPALGPTTKYMILPSILEAERSAAGNVQYIRPTLQIDLQGNVHMRPYGFSVGEEQAFGEVAEMRMYDLTNFETGTRSGGTTTRLDDATKNWTPDIYTNAVVRIVDGAGAGQTRRITTNTVNTLTVNAAFNPALNNTSKYEIEIVSEIGTATSATTTSITDTDKDWTVDNLNFTGAQVRIISGAGAGQIRTITASFTNQITVYPPFSVTPNTTSVYEISRWFPRYVGFRAANDVPDPSWNVFMNLPSPAAIPANARYALTLLDNDGTTGWVGVGSMSFPHTWDNRSADIGESIDASPLYGWPTAGYPFGSTGSAHQSIIMGMKLTLNGPPNVPFASRTPRADFNTGLGFGIMTALDDVPDAGDSSTAIGHRVLESLTTGFSNIALGKDALRSLTTGSQNVAIGFNALTSLVSGSNSVAIGSNALRSSVATTGANTAIGDSAMASLTTGINNTAIGWLAMRAATTASTNTAIGDSAAYNLTTGSENVAIGARSAPSLTTGNANVVIGPMALASGSSVSNMVAIGEGALQSLSSGTENLAIGRFAMQNSVEASFNVAIGDSALRNVELGDNNIAIGAGSLITLTSGDNNVAIGDSTLSGLTTGSDNIGIGRRILRQGATTERNIAIGDSTLDALITGTDNIGLGRNVLSMLTDGSNNIAMGHLALTSLATGNNYVVAGDSAMPFVTGGAGEPIAIGSRAMRSLVTATGTNIAIGQQSLYSVTSSFDNIAIGSFALYSHTSGDGRNIAIGNLALAGSTVGVENVAIGDSTLFFGGGRFNVAVGASALRSLDNEFAYGNVAVGAHAMWSARGASYNVAVGDSSLTSLTEGWGNVAVGGASLVSSTLTYDNTAVGDSALASNSIGRDNVAIGRLTMAGVGTGPMFSNVAVGTFAMRNNTAGASNTAIGASALLGLTTGGELDSGNVALGNLAGARAPAGTKNALFIANTDGTALLFGQFGAGRLMINATLPIDGPLPTLNAALQVNANAATDRGVAVRMAAAPTVSPVIIQNDLEATTFEIQTSGAFPSIAGVNYTWPGAAPAAAAVGTQTGRAAMTVASTGAISFTQLTSTVVTDPLDLPALVGNASADIVVPNAVVGAAPGDVVALGVPDAAANQNLVSYHAWVSANDEVTIRVNNFGANPIVALDDQVFRVIVVK